MKTIYLRFTDKFAPTDGTIAEHNKLIDKNGFVWYGKLGNPLSKKVMETILNNEEPRFLLVHSGYFDRYWVYFDKISRETPHYEDFPEYYHDIAEKFKTWFRVKKIVEAESNIMSKCTVASSGNPLSEAARHSMSPYFIINYNEE